MSWSSTIAFRGARYSVPHPLRDTRVWVRVAGDQVVVVADGPDGALEVARHPLVGPGQASILDEHYPPRRSDPLHKQPKATNPHEAAFLAIGEGATAWLIEAAGSGARAIEARMADAVALCGLMDKDKVDQALGLAAMAGRFGPGDLESILATRREEPRRADPGHSLQPGTSAWSQLGTEGQHRP